MPFIIAFAVILAVLLFLIFPSIKKHPDLNLIKGRCIAHRGLHNNEKGIPENSLSAFKAAVEMGYAIENDIHLTKDGAVVVFHDDDLRRACGIDKKICKITLSELKKLRIFGTDEVIPTLEECLNVINSQVPLLIEFKVDKNSKELCTAADKILENYKGEYLIQSFYPQVLFWYRKHRNDVCRGQLASAFKGDALHKQIAGCLLFNFISRPHFVSYEHTFKNRFFFKISVLLGAFPVGWTFKKQREIIESHNTFKSFIFEDFIPKL
ncbi:MAG: glycerophosphodiester phosphodiesterase [Ruminococcaceae bacterium]|nr:glycerophosphodiester phosphodiesterase [Oscillospiraceae bacterium]